MNKALFTTCLLCLSTYSYSADKLPTIKVKGEQSEQNDPQHLTTRIQWVKFPQINYQITELKDQERSAIIRVKANNAGEVTEADIQESTGIRALDQKLVDAVENAKVKPYSKNGKAIALVGYQTFTLTLKNATDHVQRAKQCTYSFNSKNWNKQQLDKSVAFVYLKQPQLALDQSLLKNKDRTVKFKFKTNKQGEITQVKLTKRSGINALDQQVLTAVEHASINVKRSYRTLWIYKQSSFNDEIQFKINECK
ncbi:MULTISPECIES: energy transducer TonB [Acinetobacter]|uniref:energy transducer TonB family protein n=1 Tax=Acinetobacter TaxID=469 RepID=UPI00141AD0E3|nr:MULTISPECIES: energy transducer TonB [Acinetobacter]MCS4298256.1 TonB family protein [Acinetobacter guillouiae]MCW2251860.1 TonB family protein [Acinetobacter sp. BIGb0204]NII38514.1 TonB family protein [Acinetobacter sp. BIGb0196]